MATFTFNSNTTISGSSNADLMLGTDTAGNTNDVVYGLQGDDTINATFSLSTSTLYGGQGNDVIYANNSNNVLYGNQGNDSLIIGESTDDSIYANNDTLYGGAGNDSMELEGPNSSSPRWSAAWATTTSSPPTPRCCCFTAATPRAASTATTRSSCCTRAHPRRMAARAMTSCSAPRAPETPSTVGAGMIC